MGKCVMRLPFIKSAMSLTGYWSLIGEGDGTVFHKLMQCHSLAVGHRKKCDIRLPFTKLCNVTHLLLVIGKDVMRVPYLSQNVQCHPPPVGRKLKDVMRLGVQCHSLAVGHSEVRLKKCAILLTCCWSWQAVMRLPSTKCTMSLTRCWS